MHVYFISDPASTNLAEKVCGLIYIHVYEVHVFMLKEYFSVMIETALRGNILSLLAYYM